MLLSPALNTVHKLPMACQMEVTSLGELIHSHGFSPPV